MGNKGVYWWNKGSTVFYLGFFRWYDKVDMIIIQFNIYQYST